MTLSMIWAMGKNRELGKGFELPWYIPADFKYFKQTTLGKPIIMGLKTFKSIGKPLPGRKNIVLSFEPVDIPGCCMVTSIEQAIKEAQAANTDEAFVIGGASIYQQFLSYVDKLYVTYIDHEFEADIFFPEFDISQWSLLSEERGEKNEKNPYNYYFRTYERTVA